LSIFFSENGFEKLSELQVIDRQVVDELFPNLKLAQRLTLSRYISTQANKYAMMMEESASLSPSGSSDQSLEEDLEAFYSIAALKAALTRLSENEEVATKLGQPLTDIDQLRYVPIVVKVKYSCGSSSSNGIGYITRIHALMFIPFNLQMPYYINDHFFYCFQSEPARLSLRGGSSTHTHNFHVVPRQKVGQLWEET